MWNWVLPDVTRLNRVLLGFTGLYRTSCCVTGLTDLTDLNCVSLMLSPLRQFYRVFLTWLYPFYWVSTDFTEFRVIGCQTPVRLVLCRTSLLSFFVRKFSWNWNGSFLSNLILLRESRHFLIGQPFSTEKRRWPFYLKKWHRVSRGVRLLFCPEELLPKWQRVFFSFFKFRFICNAKRKKGLGRSSGKWMGKEVETKMEKKKMMMRMKEKKKKRRLLTCYETNRDGERENISETGGVGLAGSDRRFSFVCLFFGFPMSFGCSLVVAASDRMTSLWRHSSWPFSFFFFKENVLSIWNGEAMPSVRVIRSDRMEAESLFRLERDLLERPTAFFFVRRRPLFTEISARTTASPAFELFARPKSC